MEAALTAGFDKIHGNFELLAAVYFAILEKELLQYIPSTVLLIDCGGGSSIYSVYNFF